MEEQGYSEGGIVGGKKRREKGKEVREGETVGDEKRRKERDGGRNIKR